MGAPQIIWIVLTALGLGVALAKDGERTKHSFLATAISTIISIAILVWGGFFG